ncbi:MAG: metallophosphoesterase family protein, partial [Candidatus Saccharimonas sp.]|nr:metallophosphoesterase family protein [Planctomycetaceae bacterium]
MRVPCWSLSLGLCAVVFAGCGGLVVDLETATPKAVIQAKAKPLEATTKPVAEDEVHHPSKLPDRIVLTWTGDPSRTQAVTWRTDSSVAVGLAEIAVADDNASFAKRARQRKARTEPLKSNLSTAHYHSVEFSALSPKTKYAYRVGDGANWSEWFHFTTASDQPEPFSFVYFGDAQNDLKSMWSRVIREAFTDAPKARFLLHAGDLINDANNDAHWGEWFQAGGWLNGMIPSVPTPGNHEYIKTSGETSLPDATLPINVSLTPSLSQHWRPQFALPEHGPAGLEETAYFLDYQGVRIVSLNSNEKHAEQAVWLDKVLASNPGRWNIL